MGVFKSVVIAKPRRFVLRVHRNGIRLKQFSHGPLNVGFVSRVNAQLRVSGILTGSRVWQFVQVHFDPVTRRVGNQLSRGRAIGINRVFHIYGNEKRTFLSRVQFGFEIADLVSVNAPSTLITGVGSIARGARASGVMAILKSLEREGQ